VRWRGKREVYGHRELVRWAKAIDSNCKFGTYRAPATKISFLSIISSNSMVPPAFPRPDLLVTMTGVLEILGAIGLFVPSTARLVCICWALLLVALFPANIHAARQHLTIAGRRVPRLPVRSAMQLVFVATRIAAAWLR
jgi:uncharacterized membrane protein